MASRADDRGSRTSRLTGEFLGRELENSFRLANYDTLRRQTIQIVGLVVVALTALIITDHIYAPGSSGMTLVSALRFVSLAPVLLMLAGVIRGWRYQTIDFLFLIFAFAMVSDSVIMVHVFRADPVMMAARLPLYAMIANIVFSPAAYVRLALNLTALPVLAIAFWMFTPDPWSAVPAITLILTVAFVFGHVAGTWLVALRRKDWFRTQELVRTNRDLTVYKHELEQAVLAKSMFLSNVSHELRTPLNAIIGFSDMIKMQMYGPIGSPKYQEYVQDIQNSGNHLLALINDILDLNRLEAGKAAMAPDWLDLQNTFQECRKIVLAAHRNIDPHRIQIEPAGVLSVAFDHRALHQILVNLVTNAVKYAGDDAVIRLSAEYDPATGSAAILVTDNGIGMDQQTIARLIRPFEQADAITARQAGGWGLGLPLANALAAANDCSLAIESTPGEGAIVRLELAPGNAMLMDGSEQSPLARSA